MTPKSVLQALAVALALTVAPQAVAAPQPGACLRYDELEQLHMTSDTTAVAMTTRRAAYMLTFRNSCQARSSAAYFILHRDRLGQCVDTGDLFDVSTPSPPCTVQSVAPLQAVPVTGGR